jgi:putative ABC transport system ATP-binding protein
MVEAESYFVECEDLIKIYKVGDLEVMALQGLNLQVAKKEMMAIIGASGSGKSTLLNVLGGLDKPTAGKVRVGGWDLLRLSDAKRGKYRREVVGFVWQNPSRNLIPYLSALENVEIPMILSGKPDRKRAKKLLEVVGLGHRMNHKPLDMSGGEQQRVAIAIALGNRPSLLLADEPMGALDTKTSNEVLEVFNQVREELEVTIIIVTHDPNMAKSVDRYVEIKDGKTSTEAIRKTPPAIQSPDLSDQETSWQESHEEYALLDSAGRVQLPKEFVQNLEGRRVKLNMVDGEVVIQMPNNKGSGR